MFRRDFEDNDRNVVDILCLIDRAIAQEDPIDPTLSHAVRAKVERLKRWA